MTVGIVADPCDPGKPGGLGRCIFELAKATIEALPSDAHITVYSKTPLPLANIRQALLVGNVWLTGASQLDPTRELYIFFMPVIPLFFRPKRAIVVVQDLAYLTLPRETLREKLLAFVSYRMHKRSLRLAGKVVCISEATAADIERFFGIPRGDCAIVPLAAMPLAPPAPAGELPPLPEQFFLFAGALKDRKNVANIIRAFALCAAKDSAHDLVIAGNKSGAYYESLLVLARELGVTGRVHFVGHMNDGQMAALYARALALVFASKVEGFGMPVAEAFVAGLPVITSDSGATAEVAGEAALLADPDSPEAIALAMTRIALDPALRARLKQAGLERAKAFSWAASGQKLARLAIDLSAV